MWNLLAVLSTVVLLSACSDKSDRYAEALSQIKNKDWESATYSLVSLDYKDSPELYAYASARQVIEGNPERQGLAEVYLDDINEGYSGELSPEVLRFKKEISDIYSEELAKQGNGGMSEYHGAPPKRSPWDGTYPVITSHLQLVARNPDSIEVEGCTEAAMSEDGWRILCKWSGENKFSGTDRQASWFIVSRGEVTNSSN